MLDSNELGFQVSQIRNNNIYVAQKLLDDCNIDTTAKIICDNKNKQLIIRAY